MNEVHLVKITFQPVSEAEMDVLLSEDERLNALFIGASKVEYDGYERGRTISSCFSTGLNADSMARSSFPN